MKPLNSVLFIRHPQERGTSELGISSVFIYKWTKADLLQGILSLASRRTESVPEAKRSRFESLKCKKAVAFLLRLSLIRSMKSHILTSGEPHLVRYYQSQICDR